MDEKQLSYEFMSIISESHPGLTFEEYRDSCVFLLFYHYLCLKCGDSLEECYQLKAMVRLAIRGKLQVSSFLSFMEAASPFIHLSCGDFQLTNFSFYKKLRRVQSLEKQKSYARFFRKLIKKIDAWDCGELLYKVFPDLFQDLVFAFAKMKKETYISDPLFSLYQMFFKTGKGEKKTVFLPDFQYGILLNSMISQGEKSEIYGYEESADYLEILTILAFLKKIPKQNLHLYRKENWKNQEEFLGRFDAIAIFMPEGVEPGTLISDISLNRESLEFIHSKSKGEFPFLLSALPFLSENGTMAVVFPSALLYREGKEMQIRKYLVKECNYLDTVMLLPDHLFQSVGQDEVLLLLKNRRDRTDVMFFDGTEMNDFGKEHIRTLETAWRERKTIPGFCTCASQEEIENNEYNLNLPRYIIRSMREVMVDIEARRVRMEEIDRELEEIEGKIRMYRRELGL